jgi:hypothetical protein
MNACLSLMTPVMGPVGYFILLVRLGGLPARTIDNLRYQSRSVGVMVLHARKLIVISIFLLAILRFFKIHIAMISSSNIWYTSR